MTVSQYMDVFIWLKTPEIYQMIKMLQRQSIKDLWPEERDEIKRALQENWNNAKHIKHLFDQIKELLETLADMQGNNNYMDNKLIKATYMSVKHTKEFDKDCEKLKKLPVAQYNTKDLCQTYFHDQYKEFNSQWDTLHDVSVANIVVQENWDRLG